MSMKNVKTAIKAILEELKDDDVLRDVQEHTFNRFLFDRDFVAFPTAILMTPSTESTWETNRENRRTYTFEVVIVQKPENIEEPGQLEDLIETILDKFDNDYTLDDTAVAAVEPATSQPEPVATGDKTYIVFVVTLKARVLKTITN